MKLVHIDYVKSKDILAQNIYDKGNKLLYKIGTILNKNILIKIKTLEIVYIFVNSKNSDFNIDNDLSLDIYNYSIKIIKDLFHSTKKLLNTTNSRKKTYSKVIKKTYTNIYKKFLVNKTLALNLISIENIDECTYIHSINVAVLSLYLGTKQKLTETELIDLCLGGLFHDIGKIFIDKNILQKPSSLTDDEFKTIQTHSTIGYEYIKNFYELSDVSKLIVLRHHEKINGMGYPQKLIESQIDYYTRIVSIADVYDALTANRPYRKALEPNIAINFLKEQANIMFDIRLVDDFASIILN